MTLVRNDIDTNEHQILSNFIHFTAINSKRKTRVRFVYVLPDVLNGDFLSEIKYLVNLEWNILQILTSNII